jgi:hypothetical protein
MAKRPNPRLDLFARPGFAPADEKIMAWSRARYHFPHEVQPLLSPRTYRTRLRKRPLRPPLSIEQILQWADEHFAEHGKWPNVASGHIPGTIDDTWARIDDGLLWEIVG